MLKRSLFSVFLFLFSISAFSQAIDNVDEAFFKARRLAFSSRYQESLSLCKRILAKSPNYTDVQVLQGRVYFWFGKTDSALYTLSSLLSRKPYEDGYSAIIDIERFSDNYADALAYANEGIKNFPNSEELIIKKAQVINAIGNYKAAYVLLDSLLRRNKNNEQARALAMQIKRFLYKNTVTISYTLDYFDKRFTDKWHLASISYSRRTKYLGSVIGRVNYANRFNSGGYQYELDMYPSISKKMYAYVSGGYAPDKTSPFPTYRYGISLYRSFPKAFEGELGVRYLFFSSPVFIYLASIGKYYKDFWFNLKGIYVPSDHSAGLPISKAISQSYAFQTRYYTKSANDYFTFSFGYGVSPDDRSSETLFLSPILKSYRVNLGYQVMAQYKWILYAGGGLVNEEFTRGSSILKGNDYTLNVSLQRIF